MRLENSKRSVVDSPVILVKGTGANVGCLDPGILAGKMQNVKMD